MYESYQQRIANFVAQNIELRMIEGYQEMAEDHREFAEGAFALAGEVLPQYA